jgi:hypothetical protein
MCAPTEFEISLHALLLCFGDAPLGRCAISVTSIGRGHHIIICLLDGMISFIRRAPSYRHLYSPTLVANLWDVTDKDIDKLCQSVLNKMSLNGPDIASQSGKSTRQPTSLVSAVAESRDSCKLKYLTGAAPVVYGIPFYL